MTHTPLPPLRTGRAPSPRLVADRTHLTANKRGCPFDDRAKLETLRIGNVDVDVVSPPSKRARLIHFHGGGFCFNSPKRVTGFFSSIAADLGIEVFAPAYSLAPEHPFPASLHEGRAVIDALIADDGNLPLFISGDSAGGGLALSLAVSRNPAQRLAGLVLLSPWLDLTMKGEGHVRNRHRDAIYSPIVSAGCVDDYLQGADPADPLASPLFAAFDTVPPTLIVVGAGEVSVDDNLSLARSLSDVDVLTTLCLVPQMDHCAPLFGDYLPGAADGTRAIRAFLADRLTT